MLNTIERRHEIVQLIATKGKVTVPELAAHFSVSTVTIRSDLNELDQRGLIVRAHGGAMASSRLSKELSVNEKHDANQAVKQRLAVAVAKLIEDGESIILDSGTTTEEVAKSLAQHQNLVVMTNGLNVAQQLVSADGVEVRMTGGTLRKKSLSFYGRQAESNLQQFHFDKVVLGVDGLDLELGITTHFEYEAHLNRVMCEAARTVIAVTDSSKFARRGLHKILALDELDILVTDHGLPEDYRQAFTQAGVRLILVEQ
ncbi:transcriptional repressor AgaR [Pseudoalteromonas fenneropenaei]|uniref:Transcriptional repressor AgaR n=1 Tax=Pseudoalteromonas fenneropenaei TaxID=1737459 RepID=A0ABV7CQD7_9GAMM